MPNPNPDTCQAEAVTASLLCMLTPGHEGPHYDDIDDVSWTEGRIDA